MLRRALMWLLLVGAVCAVPAAAATADQAGSYRVALARTFHVAVPHDATVNGWCYDVALADPLTHQLYLADAANKRITTINPRTGKVGAIGSGQFTGIASCHQHSFDGMGPDGLALTGGDIYAGNGNSRVLGFSLASGKRISDTGTGGKLEADELLVVGRYLVVTNPAERHPFISFVDLKRKGRPVVAKYVFPHAGGLGSLQYWHHHLYISVTTSTRSPKGGEVDALDIADPRHVHVVRRFVFSRCQPAGLAITAAGLAAVGCGSGNNQAILNVRTGKTVAVKDFPGVDLVAAFGGDFFYTSFIKPQFIVAGPTGKILQRFNFSVGTSHVVAVDPSNGDVWVPEDKGVVALFTPLK